MGLGKVSMCGSVASVHPGLAENKSVKLLGALGHQLDEVVKGRLVWFLSGELSFLNDPYIFNS